MDNKIIYTKTIQHYIFTDYTETQINLLMDNIEEFYVDSIKNYRKVWSNFIYLNNLIFTFLILSEKIKNKKEVFFALIFKYAYLDDYLSPTEDLNYLNINYFKSFASKYPEYFTQHELDKIVYLLKNNNYLSNDYNIDIFDHNYYNDILYYMQPLNYFDNIYTCYFDDELLTIVNCNRSNYALNRTLTFKEIFEILQSVASKNKSFLTKEIKALNTHKSNKLLAHYQRASK